MNRLAAFAALAVVFALTAFLIVLAVCDVCWCAPAVPEELAEWEH